MEKIPGTVFHIVSSGCARRFENVTHDESGAEQMLLFVVGGDAPQNEFTSSSMKRVEEFKRTGR